MAIYDPTIVSNMYVNIIVNKIFNLLKIRRAVRHIKKRARACLAKLGGTFEGRRI